MSPRWAGGGRGRERQAWSGSGSGGGNIGSGASKLTSCPLLRGREARVNRGRDRGRDRLIFNRTAPSARRRPGGGPRADTSSRPPSQIRRCPSIPTWVPGTISVFWFTRTRSAIARLGVSDAYFISAMAPAAGSRPLSADRRSAWPIPARSAGCAAGFRRCARNSARGSSPRPRPARCDPTSCSGRS